MKYQSIPLGMLGEELIDRKVVRTNDSSQEPKAGRVVSVNAPASLVWVLWSGTLDPQKHRHPELMLVPENPFKKKFKWSGKTFGELLTFCQQANTEGVTSDTVLNPSVRTHVAIEVELPLATNPEVVDFA